MSSLTFGNRKMQGADLNGESSLPPISGMVNVQQNRKIDLSEDDGLFVGYGFVDSPFPYRMQDMYERDLDKQEYLTAILENEYLKAEFIPSLGGRLWSLFDKEKGRELTFSNSVFRPANLAFRNAWFSGGVEWNCGVVGHHPFTCSPLFAGRLTTDDGTQVLRMYEFERIRCAVYQMDFFLHKDSKMLFARMRIVNPNSFVVPMYWWSNIAVPENKEGRVVTPADRAYTNRGGTIGKTSVPISEDRDITYPVNNPKAIDYFWKIEDGKRKYVCHLDKDGYGLIQTSTNRLKGRKLFVWGQGPGGSKWQNFLTKDSDEGRYAEIQAGLAHTQYECLPMPPKTTWEWLEAYGAMNADKDKIHGDWQDARKETEQKLNFMITEEMLENILRTTRKTIALKPADEMIMYGSGWGALENLRRERQGEETLPRHLDFDCVGSQQKQWAYLLENGCMEQVEANDVPKSFMLQNEWTHLLEMAVNGKDKDNRYSWFQLGMIYIAEKRLKDARNALEKSCSIQQSCWTYYGLAVIAKLEGEYIKATDLILKAFELRPEDPSLTKEAIKLLYQAKMYSKVIDLTDKLSDKLSRIGRVKLYKAFSYLRTGDIENAESLIYENGGIVVPDIREGENSVTDLWFEIEEAKAKKDGRVFNRKDARPPSNLDFRMKA